MNSNEIYDLYKKSFSSAISPAERPSYSNSSLFSVSTKNITRTFLNLYLSQILSKGVLAVI